MASEGEKTIFDVEAASTLVNELKGTYATGKTRSYEWRISQLQCILKMAEHHEQEILDAVFSDLSKPAFEGSFFESKSPETSLRYRNNQSGENSADDSPCLSELVHGFLESDCEADSNADDPDSKRVYSASGEVEDILRSTAGDNAVDAYRSLLTAHVSEAAEMYNFSCLIRSNRNVSRRNVMAFLRELGHNAAICKTKWDSSGGLTAENYEFIDVVVLRFQ